MLAADGVYVLIGHDRFGAEGRGWLGSIPTVFALMARSLLDRRLPRPSFEGPDRERSMAHLRGLLEQGALTSVVGHAFAREEVCDAIELLASGRAVGRIVVVPSPPTAPKTRCLSPPRSSGRPSP